MLLSFSDDKAQDARSSSALPAAATMFPSVSGGWEMTASTDATRKLVVL